MGVELLISALMEPTVSYGNQHEVIVVGGAM